MTHYESSRHTRVTSAKWLLAVGTALVLVLGLAHYLSRPTLLGTVTSKETTDPGCATSRLYGPLGGGGQQVVCSKAGYILHIRANGHDNPVRVDQQTYDATKVGSVYSG